MYKDNKKIFLSTMIEEEIDEPQEFSEMMNNNFNKYDITEIIDSIGKKSFEINFNLFKETIIKLNIKDQIIICEQILDKLQVVYNFTFFQTLNINNEEDIVLFLEFIKFIEIDLKDLIINLYVMIHKSNTDLLSDHDIYFMLSKVNELFKILYVKENNNNIIINFINLLSVNILTTILSIYNKKYKNELFIEIKLKMI